MIIFSAVRKICVFPKISRGFLFFLVLFCISPLLQAQQNPNSVTVAATFDMTNFPQWAKDLRRWEIVAFGTYPFTMFSTTFFMDTYRFAGTGWKDYRYAPWPLKSAGAVDMTNKEYQTTMIIAAGLSGVIAIADMIIVQIKRHKAQQLAESLPAGTTIITKRPWPTSPAAGEAFDKFDNRGAAVQPSSSGTSPGQDATPASGTSPAQDATPAASPPSSENMAPQSSVQQ